MNYKRIENTKKWIDSFTKDCNSDYDNFRDYTIRRLLGVIFEAEEFDPDELEAMKFLYQIYRDAE